MSDAETLEELQRFIAAHIESVEKLEILLLLSRSPDKTWTVAEVFQQIQSSIPSVTLKLGDLAREGFVKRESSDGFRYAPTLDKLRRQVAALDEFYRTRRIKVIEAIFSKTTDELRKFADAFKIRKDNE